MIEKMEESNPLVRLMKKFQKGARPVTHMGPFLPLLRIKERGLPFNDIMRDSQAMTEAALMSFEFGFESTVLPFDLNKECDIEKTRGLIPEGIPLFGECGRYDMLATATPQEITENVYRCLEMGFTTVCPPADIFPPAKLENIEAFVKAVKDYQA